MANFFEVNDAPASVLTPYEIAVGDVFDGSVVYPDTAGDWIRITLNGNTGHFFEVTPRGTTAPLENSYGQITIYDEDGVELPESEDNGGGGIRVLDGNYTGTFYVGINSFNGRWGDYTLRVTEEAAGGTHTSMTISGGDSLDGRIEANGDEDWYEVDLDATKGYVVTLTNGQTGDIINNAELALMDENGALIFEIDGDPSLSFDISGRSGTHYINVSSTFVYGDSAYGDYSLNLLEEVAGNVQTSERMDVPGTFTSRLDVAGDRDWVGLTLDPLKGYVIRMDGGESADSAISLDLTLRDDVGAEVETASGTSEAVITLNTNTPGDFYLDMGSFAGSIGDYEVEVIEEVLGDLGTLGRVANDGGLGEQLESGADQDWFQIELSAGHGYVVRMTGDGTPETLSEVSLGLRDSLGRLAVSDNGTLRTDISVTGLSGTHYITAGSGSDDMGGYRIEVIEEIAGGLTTQAEMGLSETFTSEIEAVDDTDWIAVQMDERFAYTVMVGGDGTSDGLTNISATLRDASGIALGTQTGVSATELQIQPPSTGLYFVDIGSDGENTTGVYEIDLAREESNNASTGSLIGVGGTVSAAFDYAGDVDWFRTTLVAGQTYIVNLDPNLNADPITSAPVFLYDARGGLLTGSNGLFNQNSNSLTYTPSETGVYYVQAGTAAFAADAGNYLLSLRTTTSGPATDGNDTLLGTPDVDQLVGLDGNDSLVGFDGNDVLSGDGGNDTLSGGLGDDTAAGGEGADLAFTGAGNDVVLGDEGADTLYGGADNDTLDGGADGDLLGGGTGNDSLIGGGGSDAIWGATGDDTAEGGAGNDTLGGAGGDDRLDGGADNDEVWGAAGNDTLSGGDGADTLGGSIGNDALSGGAGADELWGAAGFDTLSGGEGDDQLGAGSDNDRASGGAGDDTVSGGLGNDTLMGDAGNDVIYAAAGDDMIVGGTGNDELYGGLGEDTFDFNLGDGVDTIFASASDDTLMLDAALWSGTLSEAEVISQFGSVDGTAYVLDFGADSVRLANGGSLTQAQLEALIEIG